MKAMLANLGFVLQTTGLVILLAVPVAVVHNEQGPLVSFLVTAVAFMGSGFLLNALWQRRELDFRSSCILVTVAYCTIGLLGSIPYVYTNAFADSTLAARVVNGIFESISGYTTTGLTLATAEHFFPQSIVFYRSLTQWIGGINVVFMLLVFFYSEQVLGDVSRAIGLNHLTASLRKSYTRVFFIYAAYTALFFGLFYLFGIRNPVANFSIVFSGVSTGGFSPVANFANILSLPVYVLLLAIMMVGATSFGVHWGLFTRPERILVIEFIAMILIIGFFTFGLAWIAQLDIPTALFHVVSASTTTGFSYGDFSALGANAKMIFIVLMFVGGSAFSTAGGVKIIRMLVFFASIPWAIKVIVSGKLENLTFSGKRFSPADIVSWWFILLLGGFIIIVSAFIFTLYGFSLANAVFELTSAFSTCGLSTGVTSIALPGLLKMLLALVMLLGRVELIPFLVAFTRPVKVDLPR